MSIIRDFFARRLLRHSRLPGRMRLAKLGNPDELLRRGLISARRRLPGVDGTPLDVWAIRAFGASAAPRGTAVLIHGLWDSKARMFGLGRTLASRGFDVVLPDLRAHGTSGGTQITFGVREKDDLRLIVAALAAEGLARGPVYAAGFSMGGGIAVQYAACEPRCRGVLALAPVASCRDICRWGMRLIRPLASEREAQATIGRAGELGGFDPDAASAVEAARRLACPLIVAHGAWDLTVPTSHGRAIFAAAREPKRLIVVPRRGHNTLIYGRRRWVAGLVESLAAMPASGVAAQSDSTITPSVP